MFDVSVEGFSGPLDLLCHLVESRQLEASHIKVTQLVRVYGVYLARTQRVSAETLAEFFYMVAGLLLEKTRSLLPGAESVPITDEELMDVDEDAILETLARYRPYRSAYLWLAERREREARSFRRIADPSGKEPTGEPEYEVGDLYFLSRVWWGLFERYSEARARARKSQEDVDVDMDGPDWDGLPGALPDEAQIENRIGELEEYLAHEQVLFLSALCRAARSVKVLVVTLLALLEMCRMGKISIEQEALFADVKILAKPDGTQT